ncbi:MAG: cytochrome c oxidase subunit 4 [Salinibacterium sp.]|nr:MAG: cytochrome c oxidase subunit 4 [Salinibacterium sp.]
MRTNTRLFVILAVFFFAADGLYAWWSLVDSYHHALEMVGTFGIALTGVLSSLIAWYLWLIHRSQHGQELPEDRAEAHIDDGDAEQGHFSPWSWWPIVLAGAAALVVLGLAVGIWICFIGGAILIVSIVGWVYEYYRGYFAH